VQDRDSSNSLDSYIEGENGPKSEDNIIALSGEGNTSEKNWRDRGRDISEEAPLNQDGDDTPIEAW